MSERMFFFIVGALILTALYIEQNIIIYIICLLLLFEGITGIFLTRISQKCFSLTDSIGLVNFGVRRRFNFEALKATRIIIAFFLAASFILLNEHSVDILWFFPWFIGFSLLGAGVSGVCPTLLLTKWLGFK